MKRSILCCAIMAVMCNTSIVNAANELVVQINKQGKAAQGISAKIDGAIVKTVDSNGVVKFDLGEGAHSIQLLDGEAVVHSFRFDTAKGQLTDINIAIKDSGKPSVSVDSYFQTETAIEKSKAAKGALTGMVKAGGMPVAGAIITAAGTSYTTTTDGDGEYTLKIIEWLLMSLRGQTFLLVE